MVADEVAQAEWASAVGGPEPDSKAGIWASQLGRPPRQTV